MENGLALHAVIEGTATSRKPSGGKTYKVTFSYPRAFLSYVDELFESTVDVYWNEELVASSATFMGARQKPRKDLDPLYLFTLDCDGADTVYNLADKVDTAGDLRVTVTQMSMNLPS